MRTALTDTIAAVATPPGEGGVGIVRISGPLAVQIAGKIFRAKGGKETFESHRLYYGVIFDPIAERDIDEALMVIMNRPRSFTGEDVVEFHCHGGRLLLQRVLEIILKSGARIAEGGEFTKRAFLNGKIDLLQAEAIIEMIRAKTDLSLSVARNQLQGKVSARINSIKSRLVNLLTIMEAELDFPDEDDIHRLPQIEIEMRLNGVCEDLTSLISTYEEGRIIKDGIRVMIAGSPNVGKSTLMNLLLREERAIVTPIPGTTRDVIEEVVNIKGIAVKLMDTAGLRETDDPAEVIGLRIARERLKGAQLILYMIDPYTYREGKKGFLDGIKDKRVVIVFNKIDLTTEKEIRRISKSFKGYRVVPISARDEIGIERLEDTIFEMATGQKKQKDCETDVIITKARHKAALSCSLDSVRRAIDGIKKGYPLEIQAIEVREAVNRLGDITGEVTTGEILERIFSRFCIGK